MHLTQSKPLPEQIHQLMLYPKETPIVMVNILRFKKKIEKLNKTGKEIYSEYYEKAKVFIAKSGAKLIWKGAVASTVIGDSTNQPDLIFLVEYPTADHFLNIVSNPAYQKIAESRNIAIEYGGLIACETLK